ncbi:MAG: hypothetical protein HWN68_11145 [Desulfobacterales bacterium]|nr:hypothetical protein [Desulfobacterales bacterium]
MVRPTEEELQKAYDRGRADTLAEERKEEDRPWLIGRLWDEVSGFFTAAFSSVWAGFTEVLPNAAKIIFLEFYGIANEHTKTSITWVFDYMISLEVIDRDDLASLERVKGLPWPANLFLTSFAALILVGGYLSTKSGALLGTLRQELNKIHSPEPAPFREVMMTAFVAPEKTGEVRDALKRNGLSDADIDLLFISMYRIYDENTVRILWLRGVLSDDQMYMRMRELGYTDTRTKEIIQSWPIIPGPADLFHLVAKEAFEPDAIRMMGLGDEFPHEQVEWLKKQGISEEWALKYWYAHWDQPSIGQGFEMLHRGVIGLEELDILFRTVEIPPYWRDKLTKIAYMPYTRVDVRRMHDMGVLDDAELIKAYEDLGYDEEHALKMADFTIKYNRGAEKELTRGQVLTAYRDKLITREDTKELIMQTDYNAEQAEFFLLLEDYKEQKEYQDDMVDNIRDRFQLNLIEEHDARSQLTQMNLPGIKINVLIDKWKIKKFTARKLPSKTDLDKMLRARIINEDQWKFEMQKLGYGWGYIGWYLELVRKKS